MLEVYYSIIGKCADFESENFKNIRELALYEAVKVRSVEELYTIEPIEAVRVAVEYGRFDASKMAIDMDTVDFMIATFVEYCKYFQYDEWKPLAVEQVGSKVLFEDELLKVIYNFKIDMIAEKGNLIAPWDHKTQSRRTEPTTLSNQFLGYLFGLDLQTIVVNVIGLQKSLKPQDKFQRFPMTVSTSRIKEWQDNSLFYVAKLIESIDSDYWPMNFTSCDKYSGCRYNKLCITSPELREHKIDRDYVLQPKWDVATILEAKEN
jgi:hypothetical protein